MSFRRAKSHRHIELRQWEEWLGRHRAALNEAGLPAGVMLGEGHWIDFLQNGYLERHPEAADGFEFGHLSREQMERLLAVLEGSPEYVGQPMVGWLRHRLG